MTLVLEKGHTQCVIAVAGNNSLAKHLRHRGIEITLNAQKEREGVSGIGLYLRRRIDEEVSFTMSWRGVDSENGYEAGHSQKETGGGENGTGSKTKVKLRLIDYCMGGARLVRGEQGYSRNVEAQRAGNTGINNF